MYKKEYLRKREREREKEKEMESIHNAEQVVRRVWSFSKALDLALIDEEVRQGFNVDIGYRHGERVGYMSVRIGYILGMRDRDLFLLLIAGLMHDIGAVGGFAQYHGNPRLMTMHSEIGAKIISNFPCGDILAKALRFHHQTPADDHQSDSLMAKIISLADKVDIIMGRKMTNYKDRARTLNHINSLVDKDFYPEVAQAFVKLAGEEAFWLYLNEGELLEPTLEFLFRRKIIQDCPELDGACNIMYGDHFTDQLAEIFGHLIDQKSAFTGRHSRSVAEAAVALAEGLGWNSKDVRDMRLAAFLHDLGKLAIPRKVLDKPGALNEEEIQTIRAHTYYTYNLLTAAEFSENIVKWGAYHHERLDGRGYPFRLAANDICIGARLMSIADIFTALTEERPYRNASPKGKAISIMERGIGANVDGELLEVAKGILL